MSPRALKVRRLGYTDPRGFEYAVIPLDALIVDLNNNRLPTQASALESMLALVKADNDGLFTLASDIVEQSGTNPAELSNVSPSADGTFVVREGNRRLTARKLLRNPQQLKGHVSDAELKRWSRLGQSPAAKGLPGTVVCVIGVDHEQWVDRRHLGAQGGKGLIGWDTEAKRRREAKRRNRPDLALHVLDSLKAHDPERFAELELLPRTLTTFARVVESDAGRTALGLELGDRQEIVLRHGHRSILLLEQILRDLRRGRADKKRLTSRTISTTPQIVDYLRRATSPDVTAADASPVTLAAPSPSSASPGAPPGHSGGIAGSTATRPKDVMREMHVPRERRLFKIFDELRKARRSDMPNAAIALTRVLLELSIDHYAAQASLPFANDANPVMEAAIVDFYKDLNVAGVTLSAAIKEAIRAARSKSMKLSDKVAAVFEDLAQRGVMTTKDKDAHLRDIRSGDVVALLNDALHRRTVVPSLPRVTQILEAIRPLFNAIVPAE